MKNEHTIPLHQLVFFLLLLLLIILRVILSNLDTYINLVNYISMVTSILGVWVAAIAKARDGRSKNICKSVFVLLLSLFVICGFLVLVLNARIPPIANDIFTLTALLFCICNTVFEEIIKRIFSLRDSYDE